MSRTKDYFAPVEQPDNMPQEQEIFQSEEQGQQVFAHMIRELTHNFRPELEFD